MKITAVSYSMVYMQVYQIDGLVQEWRNSSVLAMELRLSCTNPLKWHYYTPRNEV